MGKNEWGIRLGANKLDHGGGEWEAYWLTTDLVKGP